MRFEWWATDSHLADEECLLHFDWVIEHNVAEFDTFDATTEHTNEPSNKSIEIEIGQLKIPPTTHGKVAG